MACPSRPVRPVTEAKDIDVASHESICQACQACTTNMCFDLNKDLEHTFELPEQFPQTYDGVRFTADAMDCALPISIDPHSGCSYSCLYCFSNNLMRSPDRNAASLQKKIKEGSFYAEWNIKKLESFLARDLKDPTSKAMYPLMDAGCPVQLGALGDPFDDLELHSGWAKQAIPLFIKYKQAVRVGTKGGKVLARPEYLKLLEKSPEQFWFAFSCICNSDELISKIDIKAPVTSQRLKAMKLLTDIGCSASLRFRPFLPGVSDAYPGEPNAWKCLIERSKEAGARALSFEYIFMSNTPTDRQKAMNRLMFKAMGRPKFMEEWNRMSGMGETCRRGSRTFKYEMTMNAYHLCKKLEMNFGCSDPHFKEFNSTGNCCGMPEDGDPWFSNWSRRQMSEVIVQARRAYLRGETPLFTYNDWKPEWAHNVRLGTMVALGDWHSHRVKKEVTFGDHMRGKWNNPKHPRGPYHYFGGVLQPVGIDSVTGDLIYTYKDWSTDFDKKFHATPNIIL